jgi:hypothetical protein
MWGFPETLQVPTFTTPISNPSPISTLHNGASITSMDGTDIELRMNLPLDPNIDDKIVQSDTTFSRIHFDNSFGAHIGQQTFPTLKRLFDQSNVPERPSPQNERRKRYCHLWNMLTYIDIGDE